MFKGLVQINITFFFNRTKEKVLAFVVWLKFQGLVTDGEL